MAFIDFGIVGRFSPDTWSGVSRLADGVAQEDFTVMAEVRQETPSSSSIRRGWWGGWWFGGGRAVVAVVVVILAVVVVVR